MSYNNEEAMTAFQRALQQRKLLGGGTHPGYDPNYRFLSRPSDSPGVLPDSYEDENNLAMESSLNDEEPEEILSERDPLFEPLAGNLTAGELSQRIGTGMSDKTRSGLSAEELSGTGSVLGNRGESTLKFGDGGRISIPKLPTNMSIEETRNWANQQVASGNHNELKKLGFNDAQIAEIRSMGKGTTAGSGPKRGNFFDNAKSAGRLSLWEGGGQNPTINNWTANPSMGFMNRLANSTTIKPPTQEQMKNMTRADMLRLRHLAFMQQRARQGARGPVGALNIAMGAGNQPALRMNRFGQMEHNIPRVPRGGTRMPWHTGPRKKPKKVYTFDR